MAKRSTGRVATAAKMHSVSKVRQMARAAFARAGDARKGSSTRRQGIKAGKALMNAAKAKASRRRR